MSDKLERAKAILAGRLATATDSEFVYVNSAGKRCPRPLWLRKKKPAAQPANVSRIPATRRASGK